jgi:hypothetical protein
MDRQHGRADPSLRGECKAVARTGRPRPAKARLTANVRRSPCSVRRRDASPLFKANSAPAGRNSADLSAARQGEAATYTAQDDPWREGPDPTPGAHPSPRSSRFSGDRPDRSPRLRIPQRGALLQSERASAPSIGSTARRTGERPPSHPALRARGPCIKRRSVGWRSSWEG